VRPRIHSSVVRRRCIHWLNVYIGTEEELTYVEIGYLLDIPDSTVEGVCKQEGIQPHRYKGHRDRSVVWML